MNPLQATTVNTPPPTRPKRPRETCYSLPKTLLDPDLSPGEKRRAISSYVEDQRLNWQIQGMQVKLERPPRYDESTSRPLPAQLASCATQSVLEDAARRQLGLQQAHRRFWERLNAIPEAENQPVE